MMTHVSRFEEASLLLALGYPVAESKFDPGQGRAGRVLLGFDDPRGEVQRILLRHRTAGVSVNSAAYERALDAVKKTIFRTREGN